MNVNKTELYRQAINTAASLVMGKPIINLFDIAENQKTISGNKLLKMLEDAQEKYRDAAYLMRQLANEISSESIAPQHAIKTDEQDFLG